jgi:hypothetical protein
MVENWVKERERGLDGVKETREMKKQQQKQLRHLS